MYPQGETADGPLDSLDPDHFTSLDRGPRNRDTMTHLPRSHSRCSLAPVVQTSASDRVVAAAGLELHVRCDGERIAGAPMVVLEAGAGNSANTWRDVFGPIAQFARVCALRPAGARRQPACAAATRSIGHYANVACAACRDGRAAALRHGRPFVGRTDRQTLCDAVSDGSRRAGADRFVARGAGEAVRRGCAAGGRRKTSSPSPSGAAPREIADLETMGAELSKDPWHANLPLVVLTRTPPPPTNRDERLNVWQELQRELGHSLTASRAHRRREERPLHPE